LDILKSIIGKFSQVYSKMYNYKQQVEHTGEVTSKVEQIAIVKYYAPERIVSDINELELLAESTDTNE